MFHRVISFFFLSSLLISAITRASDNEEIVTAAKERFMSRLEAEQKRILLLREEKHDPRYLSGVETVAVPLLTQDSFRLNSQQVSLVKNYSQSGDPLERSFSAAIASMLVYILNDYEIADFILRKSSIEFLYFDDYFVNGRGDSKWDSYLRTYLIVHSISRMESYYLKDGTMSASRYELEALLELSKRGEDKENVLFLSRYLLQPTSILNTPLDVMPTALRIFPDYGFDPKAELTPTQWFYRTHVRDQDELKEAVLLRARGFGYDLSYFEPTPDPE